MSERAKAFIEKNLGIQAIGMLGIQKEILASLFEQFEL
jgi:hypothetical protein